MLPSTLYSWRSSIAYVHIETLSQSYRTMLSKRQHTSTTYNKDCMRNTVIHRTQHKPSASCQGHMWRRIHWNYFSCAMLWQSPTVVNRWNWKITAGSTRVRWGIDKTALLESELSKCKARHETYLHARIKLVPYNRYNAENHCARNIQTSTYHLTTYYDQRSLTHIPKNMSQKRTKYIQDQVQL